MSIPLRVLLAKDREEDAELTLRALRAGGYRPIARLVDSSTTFSAALEEEEWDVIAKKPSEPPLGSDVTIVLKRRARVRSC